MKDLKCDGCPSTEELKTFEVRDRGYLSAFDGDSFQIRLCPACIKVHGVETTWFNNDEVFKPLEQENDEWTTTYLHENDIMDLIKELTPEAKERIENCENVFDLNRKLAD